ncbi:DMT family transporter [Haloglomus irregulare]|uniref:DMT family transporter n=1 Tax=Haloglomus irregulare TaxID=2234134 RepID=UPI001EE29361|nr:DMT family transporter [Haloglomus irregulare]
MSRLAVPPHYRDAALFVLLAALFGGSFAAIKTGLAALPPLFFAALRFDVAAVALLAYVAVTRDRETWLPHTRGDYLGIAVAAALLIAANNALLFLGQGSTTTAAASVMYGLNPILAPLFAWWLLKQRLAPLGALGIAVALGGVVIIVQPSPESLAGGSALGQLLVLGAAAAVALGSVGLQWVEPRMDSVPLTTWAMAGGAVLLHLTSLGAGEAVPPLVSLAPAAVLSVLAVAIPSTAIAYPIYFGLIGRVGPVRANLVAYAVPVFATLLGWLLLGEVLSPWTAVGFLVVVAGFALVERAVIREEWLRLRRRFAASEADRPTADPPCDD